MSEEKYLSLYVQLCSLENLERAFKKARKGKTRKLDVVDFERNLPQNLLQLHVDLLFHAYRPEPLKTFVIKDPKTRKISKSAFRDRVVHPALCNYLEPLYEKIFIYDSYANRKGKGTLKAIQRFDYFKRKVFSARDQNKGGYCLKADIRHYFETVDHQCLLKILSSRIRDQKVLFLVRSILNNYSTTPGKSMPLGNLTSQFLANVYLNELDQFVKHQLKVKYYIRYVDDFVLLHGEKKELEYYFTHINDFLRNQLRLVLHPAKSKIIPLSQGITFLGFRIFHHHKLLRKSNIRTLKRRLIFLKQQFDTKRITYDRIYESMLGWLAYAKQGNTYNLRRKVGERIEKLFPLELSTREITLLSKLASQK